MNSRGGRHGEVHWVVPGKFRFRFSRPRQVIVAEEEVQVNLDQPETISSTFCC